MQKNIFKVPSYVGFNPPYFSKYVIFFFLLIYAICFFLLLRRLILNCLPKQWLPCKIILVPRFDIFLDVTLLFKCTNSLNLNLNVMGESQCILMHLRAVIFIPMCVMLNYRLMSIFNDDTNLE